MPGLCALAEFHLDHFDLIACRLFAEFFWRECSIVIAAAEITRADFIDQIATPFAVVTADPALARVMGKTAHFRTVIQC